MTGTNILQQKELSATAGNPDARDALLCSRYGLTLGQLSAVRSIDTIWDRIITAAELLYARAKVVTPGIECQQLTELTIAAIVYPDWEKPATKGSCVHNHLKDHTPVNLNPRLKPSLIHPLRKQVGAYAGNLEEAASFYPGFLASDDDFLKSTIIPLQMTPSLENLLGIFYACGIIPQSKKNCNLVMERSEPYETMPPQDGQDTNGKPKLKFPFFDTLPSRVREAFNLVVNVNAYLSGSNGNVTLTTSNGAYTYSTRTMYMPRISIPSKALTTWLMNDLGLFNIDGKPARTNPKMKKFLSSKQSALAFLSGIVDCVGTLYSRNGRFPDPIANCSSLNQDQSEVVSYIRKLAGYSARHELHSSRYVGAKAIKEMFDSHYFTNPLHLRRLTEYYAQK